MNIDGCRPNDSYSDVVPRFDAPIIKKFGNCTNSASSQTTKVDPATSLHFKKNLSPIEEVQEQPLAHAGQDNKVLVDGDHLHYVVRASASRDSVDFSAKLEALSSIS